MPATDKTRPKLRNLDEMFDMMGGTASQNTGAQQPENEKTPFSIRMIPFDVMDDFSGHPFKFYNGERKVDMVDSIRDKGILQPLILRQKDRNRYEILSGHNRKYCGIEAGLHEGPAIVKDGLNDDEALMYVIETNLIQRSFSDMSHSEKAAVLSMQHSKLFSQGKRNDILEELKSIENPLTNQENKTCAQIKHRLKSRDLVASEYSLSKDTVARYLRIHKLSTPLKDRLDKGEIPFIPAVTLSFLKHNEQQQIDKCISLNDFKIDMKKSDLLRQGSEKGNLGEDSIYLILNGEVSLSPKKNRSHKFKIKPKSTHNISIPIKRRRRLKL